MTPPPPRILTTTTTFKLNKLLIRDFNKHRPTRLDFQQLDYHLNETYWQ